MGDSHYKGVVSDLRTFNSNYKGSKEDYFNGTQATWAGRGGDLLSGGPPTVGLHDQPRLRRPGQTQATDPLRQEQGRGEGEARQVADRRRGASQPQDGQPATVPGAMARRRGAADANPLHLSELRAG